MSPSDAGAGAPLDLLSDLIAKARKAGADAADALFAEGASIAHAQRLGATEKLERSEGRDLGLRVLIGKRQAIVSSTDTQQETLDELVGRAVAMARSVPEDPHCGLAEPGDIATEIPDLDILDPEEPSVEALIERARRAEDAARAVEGVTNSEGAEASWGTSRVTLAASNGFAGTYGRSGHGISVSVLAGEGTAMERDYDWSSSVYAADLDDPDALGTRAGERAVRRLNPRKVKSTRVPVVYDPRASGGLIRHLASAINGSAVARGTSFLKDAMDTALFADGVSVVDDPRRPRGLSSKPFDGEGIATARRAVIDKGRLTTWFLDLRSARQLGLATTGHASRGTSGPPGPSATNLYLEAGDKSPEALIGEIEDGFYITDMIGFGVDNITGDYSRGASGFWIEKGELTYPVSELTVAGNLKDMFANLTPANDLVFRYGTDAPTVRVDGLTVAGA